MNLDTLARPLKVSQRGGSGPPVHDNEHLDGYFFVGEIGRWLEGIGEPHTCIAAGLVTVLQQERLRIQRRIGRAIDD